MARTPRHHRHGSRRVVGRRPGRLRRAIVAVLVAMGATAGVAPVVSASDGPPRIDLKVLVVADTGTEPAIAAWTAALQREGVPYDLVTLRTSGLPALQVDARHARYQGVVLSNAYQPNLTEADRARLEAFEAAFGLRRVYAYAWPNPSLGLEYPSAAGDMQGTQWTVTPAGASTFVDLAGSVPVIDNAYGYLATPLDDSFTTLVGDRQGNAMIGSRTRLDGVAELVVTVDSNSLMTHAQILSHGLITWVTGGVHLGYKRSYLSVHIDDVFLPDSRWSIEGNCTPGDDCPAGVAPTADIRMTPSDVMRAVQWQRARAFTMTMAYNGAGTAEAVAEAGRDPLTEAFVANRASFAWINHTYDHPYFGCVQDFTVVPWRCATDANGKTLWYPQSAIVDQIKRNIDFAKTHKLAINPKELVTGEHSGLASLPQMPTDNPNLGPALDSTGVKVIASDASREAGVRPVGKALTSPRHPNNIFYNVATTVELVDEYNWLYLPPSLGGSCVDTAITTCRSTPATFADIVDLESRIMMLHVMSNDPKSTYMHQSNLAEEGVAYPLLDRVLDRYRAWFKDPLVQPTMTAITQRLTEAASYQAHLAAGQVSAHRIGKTVVVSAPKGVKIPVTTPAGTTVGGAPFGELHAGERSGWLTIGKEPVTLVVP